jgi:hypothetical protein
MLIFSKCHNIKVDGDEYTAGFLGLDWFPSAGSSANKETYENDVISALNRIINTMTGWAVINEIFYRSKGMVIKPFHPSAADPINAYATPNDLVAATLKDTTALDGSGNPVPGRIIGTGVGSDTIINFSSSVFASASGSPIGVGAAPDEILLHEMVHGLRQMMGRSVREKITGNPGMDNYEEFVAITVANVFRSERGGTTLRRDHHGFLPLTGPTTDPAIFKSTYNTWMIDIAIEQPRFAQNLGQAKAAFNPFA